MDPKSIIFEERTTTISSGGAKTYKDYLTETLWPEWAKSGVSILCLLAGHMGESQRQLTQIARFPDFEVWQDLQMEVSGRDRSLVEDESVRLLKSMVDSRPKNPLPVDDHKHVYGYRKFFINPADIEEVAALSEQGVWPRFEAHGCRVMGLWTPIAVTNYQEVLLVTGYNSLAHWEETRLTQQRPEHISRELWDSGRDAALKRASFTINSWVTAKRPIFLEGHE